MARFPAFLLLLILAWPAISAAGSFDGARDLLCAGEPGFPKLEDALSFRIEPGSEDLLDQIALLPAAAGAGVPEEDASDIQRVGDLEIKLGGSTAALLVPVESDELSPFLDVGVGEGKGSVAKTEDADLTVAAAGFQTYRLGAGVGCVLDDRTQLDLGYHFAAGTGEPEVWEALTGDPEPEGEGHNLSLGLKLSF